MSVKYFCDMCEVEVPPGGATFWSVEEDEHGNPSPRPAKQLCSDCADKVERFITGPAVDG